MAGTELSPCPDRWCGSRIRRKDLEMGAFARSDRQAILDDLDRVYALFPRLKERIAQVAGTLSGGEQQMLAIGRGLMARPKILLLAMSRPWGSPPCSSK